LLGQRGDEHGYASSLAAIAIDLAAVLERLFDLREDSLTFIDVRQFASAESQGKLHSVSSEQKFAGSIDLYHKIVRVDLRGSDADFLKFGLVPVSLCVALLLGEIILVLAVIENTTDWGGGVGDHFYEVKTGLTGHCLSFAKGYNSDLPLILIDQANW
jgi:hypothetical protein